jgi:Lar family restriction alleviation protein
MNEEKLLPCPCCGSKDVYMKSETAIKIVYCLWCNLQVRVRHTFKDAIKRWNRRSADKGTAYICHTLTESLPNYGAGEGGKMTTSEIQKKLIEADYIFKEVEEKIKIQLSGDYYSTMDIHRRILCQVEAIRKILKI